MKKNRGTCLYDLNSLNTQKKKRKVFKIIKNSFIGLLICVVQLSFIETAKAQTPNDLISLELHNVSLQSGLDSIGKLSGYKMAYSLDLVSPYRNISLPRQQRSVSATLRLILSKTDLTYSFKGSNILIIKRTSVQNRSNVVDDDTKSISGKVYDNQGNPLPGVTVRIKGRNVGTTTDGNGRFSMMIQKGDALTLSFIGFITQTIKVNDDQYFLNISLVESSTNLQEVVVVSNGYQKIDKTVATGSFELLTAKDIQSSPSVNIMERLEGKVPGVRFDVRNNTVQIRGTNSFYSSSTPLIIIDGFPAMDQSLANYPGTSLSGTSGDSNNAILSSFNMSDIESITFLKDAAATAIWGSKAANGVIVIETKKGREKQGPPEVNYNMTLSVSAPANINKLNVMNSAQYIDLEQELFDNNYLTDPTTNPRYANISEAQQYMFAAQRGEITPEERDSKLQALSQGSNYSQIKKYLLQNAVTQQYNLSLSGHHQNGSYYVSGNFTDNTPVFKSNWAKNYSITANITNDFLNKKLSVYAGINQTYTNTKVNDAALTAISPGEKGLRPYDMLVDDEGNSINKAIIFTPEVIQSYENKGYLPWTYNTLDELHYSNTRYNKNSTRINARITAKPVDWLSVSLSGIYQKMTNEKTLLNELNSYNARDLINEGTTINNGTLSYGVPLGGIYKTSNDFAEDYSLRGQISIDKSWNQINHIQFLAGSEIRQNQVKGYNQTRYGYDEDTQTSSAWNPTVAYATIYGYNKTLGYYDGTILGNKQRYLSYYNNASYSYKNKYFVSGSMRFDDYSMIGVERSKRAKPLWSGGFKWNAKNENFLSNISWLSGLSARLTYGTGGTVPSTGTPFPLISITGRDAYTNLIYGSISSPGNQMLGWETTRTINEGIDLSLWQSRLNLTLEFYQKKSYGLMADVPFNSTYGWSTMTFNTGDLKGHGYDLKISGDIIRNAYWNWNVSFNLSYNTNKVTDNRFPNTSTVVGSTSIITTGYPVDNMFLYRWAGLDGNGQSQIYNAEGEKLSSTSYPTIKAEDRYYAGRTTPPYFGGLSQSIRYKNITLSLYASFEMGHKVLKNDINSSYYPTSTSYSGFLATSKALVNRWRKPGDENSTNIPGIINSNFNSIDWYLLSDAGLISGDNIRMNQITLNYNLPGSILKKLKAIRSLTIGASVSNLGLLWTRNKEGIDPDYIFSGSYTSMPPSKNYSFNLNVSF
ncbi:MAG: SusC/RagA family TonB-linked outer membrane protein [Bacteroides sp.]|jgi:TonB-linked SusC/RagA family outer membrane protein|nr:SusC/RagA family TonB-linked outer membrane protein [Bacteroides sp.]MCI1683686.1 SusC/RagA family TonB-linked outer membrane protein [Bacteroides sp.]